VDQATIADFIDNLDIPDTAKTELKALSPATYIGAAESLTDELINL